MNKQKTQTIKAAAIILVIFSHIHRVCDLPHSLELILNPCGYLGVSLFLFVSGYGCMRSNSINNSFSLFKRIKRVVIPLAITTLFSYTAMLFFTQPPSIYVAGLQAVGLNSIMCGACWYITFQYICYFAFFLLGSSPSIIKTIIWAIISSISVLIISIFFEIEGEFINLWGLNAFSFYAGVILGRSLEHDNKRKTKLSFLLFATFFALFIVVYFVLGNPDEYIYRNPLKSLVSLVFVLSVFYSFGSEKICAKGGFLWVGKESYYIYLSHAFWIFCFNEIAYDKNIGLAILKLVIVTFVGTLLISRSKVFIEKVAKNYI